MIPRYDIRDPDHPHMIGGGMCCLRRQVAGCLNPRSASLAVG